MEIDENKCPDCYWYEEPYAYIDGAHEMRRCWRCENSLPESMRKKLQELRLRRKEKADPLFLSCFVQPVFQPYDSNGAILVDAVQTESDLLKKYVPMADRHKTQIELRIEELERQIRNYEEQQPLRRSKRRRHLVK